MSKTVTINDVARTAGVSITTVSRILNNKPDVSPETRKRVLEAIVQLDYTPHAQAKNLAAGKSRSIAVLYPAHSNGLSELEFEFFVGASTIAAKRGFLFNLFVNTLSEHTLLNLYRGNQIDGVILMEIHLQDDRVKLLQENEYPFVMIGHCADNEGLSYIDLDFEASMLVSVDHLYKLGHRHIGLLSMSKTLRDAGYGPVVRTGLGYVQACARFGLNPLVYEAPTTIEDAYAATHRMLDEHPELTAIVTLHPDSSVGIVRAVQSRGLSIPQDFSLIGIVIDRIAKLISPPLTAITFPAYLMGERAAQMLIRRLLESEYEPEQELLTPHLVIRDSTGPVR